MLLFSNLFGAYSYQVERIPEHFFFSFGQLERDFPGGSDSKESACNARDPGLIPGFGKIPWKRERLPTPVFCPGEFHGLYSPQGPKNAGHD